MSINVFIASGNAGKDLECRYTTNQKCIGEFSLPVKQGWGQHEKTSWVSCKILGERAEKLKPYITKGTLVTVQGSFVLEEWEHNGQKHSRPTILVDNVAFGSSNQPANGGQGNVPRQAGSNTAPRSPQPAMNEPDFSFDDSIPF